MREGEHQLARRQPAEQLAALLRRAGLGDQAAGEYHGGEERLGGEHPAQLLGDDADLDGTGAHPAVLLGEREPEDAHLGQLPPHGLAEAGVRGHRPAAVLEVGVRPADQAAHGLAQGLLLVVISEVHGVLLPGSLRDPGSCGR